MKIWIISAITAIIFLLLGAVGGAIGGYALATKSTPKPADQSLSWAKAAVHSLVSTDGSPRSLASMRNTQKTLLALNIVLVAQMYDRLSDTSKRNAAVKLAQQMKKEPLLQLSGSSGIARDAEAAQHCIIEHQAQPQDVVKCVIQKQRSYRNEDSRKLARAG